MTTSWTLDIPVFASEVPELQSRKHVSLVYPYHAPSTQNLRLDAAIRLVGLDDEAMFTLMEGSAEEDDRFAIRMYSYCEILYVRDCALRNVLSGEWDTCTQAGDAEDFLGGDGIVWGPELEKVQMTLEDPVRIICLRKNKYNLKDLNKRFIDEFFPDR